MSPNLWFTMLRLERKLKRRGILLSLQEMRSLSCDIYYAKINNPKHNSFTLMQVWRMNKGEWNRGRNFDAQSMIRSEMFNRCFGNCKRSEIFPKGTLDKISRL